MGASSIALPAEGDGVEDLLEARVITNGGEIGIAEKVCGPLVAVAYGAVEPLQRLGVIACQRVKVDHV